jgi:hypothetical protein
MMPAKVKVADLVFEERAENLTEQELRDWTVLSDAEQTIVKKLLGPGAKLLSGPRGSGKSTLLRTAFFQAAKTKSALGVYVNYSKALALEPLFHLQADAAPRFRQWVLAKILSALTEVAELWGLALTAEELTDVQRATSLIQALEAGSTNAPGLGLSPSGVISFLRGVAERAGVIRTVLLLDDAAHAFSVQQQREFFEVFRELRSRDVSGKAAIYPGVTSFSPAFQIGHEAELIEAWFRPDSDGYLITMRQVVAARFPHFAPKDSAAVDALALASFGLPRGFLNMCYQLHESVANNSRTATLESIATQADIVRTVFSNIADRLPRFTNYIDVGNELERAAEEALKTYNAKKPVSRKAGSIALANPIHDDLKRVLRFMEYAGLARSIETLSKGSKGTYQRYLFNYACLIEQNALSLGKSYRVADLVEALRSPSAHSLVKTKAQTLLGSGFEGQCTLAMPPCPKCGTKRLSEEQKFCMNCGFELKMASVYQDLLSADISKLPLPQRKIEALSGMGFHTVKQLLSDETQSYRQPGTSIGGVWAKKILAAAEEWVSG